MPNQNNTYEFVATVWVYPGMSAWHFVTLPVLLSGDLKSRYGKSARGWGSLPVLVTVGKTSWKTSIFPDRKAGAYLLPIKSEIRKKEDIGVKDKIAFTLKLKI
jgi:hypothetical protein